MIEHKSSIMGFKGTSLLTACRTENNGKKNSDKLYYAILFYFPTTNISRRNGKKNDKLL